MQTLGIWLIRLLLAALLFLGSEILLWINSADRTVTEWGLLIIGFLTLSILILDLTVRFRIRNVYDIMLVMAIYGLLVSLLLYPTTAFEEFPPTLISRVFGGHTFLGTEMFGLFLVLLAGNSIRYRRLLLVGSIIVGFFFGIWIRWSPEFLNTSATLEPLKLGQALLAIGVIFSIMILLTYRLPQLTQSVQARQFRLNLIELVVVLVIVLALLGYQFTNETVDSLRIGSVIALSALCLVLLWTRSSNREEYLLTQHLPATAPAPLWLGMAVILFFAMTIVAYSLPFTEFAGYHQFSALSLGFIGVGFLWLPIVAARLSTDAFGKYTQIN